MNDKRARALRQATKDVGADPYHTVLKEIRQCRKMKVHAGLNPDGTERFAEVPRAIHGTLGNFGGRGYYRALKRMYMR